MVYDFETLVDRRYAGSVKWNPLVQMHPNAGPEVCPFSTADMELKTAPEIVDALKKCLDEEILGYTCANQAYFDAVKHWMKTRHGWEIETEWIMPSDGIVPALFSAAKAFCQSGDGILCLTPVYAPFYMAIQGHGCRLIESPLLLDEQGKYQIDFEDMDRKAADAKIFFLCSPHNPGGRVWTLEELRKIGEICKKHQLLVVSDEIHFDLIFPGHTHTVFSLACPELRSQCVICTAPSKSFNIAGLQDSNLIIENPELRRKIDPFLPHGLNIIGYRACQAAYTSGAPWLDECMKLIVRNQNLVQTFFQAKLPQCRVTPIEGTYLAWVDMRPLGLEPEKLIEKLQKEAAFFVNDGAWFGKEAAGFIRIDLACPTWALQKALDRLENTFLKNLGKEK